MNALKRALYLQAAVWAVAGVALAGAPRVILVSLFGQAPLPDYAWVRLLGLHAFGLAMFMVLVAHRIEELWWWAWGFAFVTVATTATVVLNAAFGLPDGSASWLWWLFSAISVAFSGWVLYGLYLTSRERPVL